ncbi:MAG: SIMPL domain-containing protein [Chloroflexi bacterium]|nr:SIMPL domain-containing protein [Chloroflexota bacterium]
MKKSLFTSLSAFLIVGLLAACAPTAMPSAPATVTVETKPVTTPADTNDEKGPLYRSINVTGEGQVFLVPDVAYVYIGVHSQSTNVSEALKDNNEQAKAVSDALKGLGVEEKDIQTTSFNIYPQQQYEPGTGNVTGTIYMVDNVVYVTVRELKRLGELLDVVVRSGANSINSINFDVVDKETALSKARELAIENARKQAEELAKASGVVLGDVQSISTSSVSTPLVKEMYGMGGGGMGAVSQPAPISAGQLVLTVNISMSYLIK